MNKIIFFCSPPNLLLMMQPFRWTAARIFVYFTRQAELFPEIGADLSV